MDGTVGRQGKSSGDVQGDTVTEPDPRVFVAVAWLKQNIDQQ